MRKSHIHAAEAGKSYGQNEYQKSGNDRLRIRGRIIGICADAERKIEVPVLDATAIGVSIFRNDIETAGSVMFLLGIGELLESGHTKNL